MTPMPLIIDLGERIDSSGRPTLRASRFKIDRVVLRRMGREFQAKSRLRLMQLSVQSYLTFRILPTVEVNLKIG